MIDKPYDTDDLYSTLLALMREYGGMNDRLPTEEALAAKLGVSRVKLRDVLAALEANGYINRRKGLGTIINHYLLAETARLDIDNIYEELIEDSGFKANTLIRKLRRLDTTPELIATKLQLAVDEPIHVIEKVIYADQKPAIYLKDYVPPKHYNRDNIDMHLLARSTFRFVQELSDEVLENMVVRLDAIIAIDDVREELRLAEGSPILRLDSVCYGLRHTPILYSIEYHNTKMLPYTIHKRLRRTRYYRSEQES